MSYKKPIARTVNIANGATDSEAISIGDYLVAGIQTPGALTSATLTFHASTTLDGTYAPVYDSDGNAVSVAIGTSRAVGLSGAEADALAPWPFVKVVMGSAEGAARVLLLALKG
jgi:hypothetical protein